MITFNNYATLTKNIDFSSAPDAIRATHGKFDSLAKYYGKNDSITETIDLYLQKLNAWAPAEKSAAVPIIQKAERIKTPGTVPATKPTKIRVSTKSTKSTKKSTKSTTKSTTKPTKIRVSTKSTKSTMPSRAKKEKPAKMPKKAAAKANSVKEKPVKTSKVKSPELTLISGFISLNKKPVSVASFEKKLHDASKLETVKHRDIITEIKEKLKIGIQAAKADGSGKIKATIAPEFVAKCKETIKNAKELLRVSYLGGSHPVKKKR